MRHLKKLLSAILASAALLAAAACGGNPASPPSGSVNPSSAPSQTPGGTETPVSTPSYLDTVSELIICYLPGESSDEYVESRSFLQDELGAYLGVKITEINAADYNAVVEAMRTKKADIASYGPVSYVQAHDRSNAEALVIAAPNSDKSQTGYTSLIIVKPGSPIKTLADVEGKSFAYVDPSSTSGN
ncbi:MAG: phosphate/phosphite/phosphonate ABC transporter substrate-binding protein, partial [Oscillospiraceae bacterium]|nr:phosphate/phosphite/phosphonate ABC transporter substrate-binding protein [Oscillospiraceae bacterium]